VLEEDYHNLEAVYEARRWNEASKVPLFVSQAGALGIGSYGWVSRLYDYFDLTDIDIHKAAEQLESASSLFGLPMTGLKFWDDSYDERQPLIMRTLLLTAFTTSMGVVDFYDQFRFEGDRWDDVRIN
jgi:hypothetical protein